MNIDFSNLSKEQKQYVVLGIIGVVAVGFGLFYGVSTFGGSLSSGKTELEELNDKIERAERELARRSKTMDDFNQYITVLESHFDNLPPEENYYSWATEIVYSKGRNAGLQIESADEIGGNVRNIKAAKDPVYFETYALRITARGGYEETKAFIKDIEDNHPLVRFTGVEISKGNDPEMHSVQLFVQWPHKLQRIADLWKGQYRRPEIMVAQAEPTPAAKPAPAVAKAEPKPEPVVVEPEPEVKSPAPVAQAEPTPVAKPAPAVAKAEPKPEPVVVKPEPEVKSPAPVVVKAPAPKPVENPEPVIAKKPTPPVSKPGPVVAKAAPVAEPEPKPNSKPAVVKAEQTPVVSVPAVEEPKPVVAEEKREAVSGRVVVKAAPKSVVMPEAIVAESKPEPVEEKISEPAPIIVKTPEPKVEAKPAVGTADPESVEDDHVLSILASIDEAESGDVPKEEPAPAVENEMASLLASLDSNGIEPNPETTQAAASTDAADLENYLTQLSVQTEASGAAEPEVEAESVVVSAPEVEVVQSDEPVIYASTSKSAKILEEILTQGKPKTSKSLGSFLDGMVGDINESR